MKDFVEASSDELVVIQVKGGAVINAYGPANLHLVIVDYDVAEEADAEGVIEDSPARVWLEDMVRLPLKVFGEIRKALA